MIKKYWITTNFDNIKEQDVTKNVNTNMLWKK